MAEVVVIGGGFGGLAAAGRLAKLGHAVTLVEAAERLGGVAQPLEHHTPEHHVFRWDAGPATMTLPAAARDLFRKSGRPLERVVDLVPITTPRRHVFAGGAVLDVPVGNRAGQYESFEGMLGPEAAEAWQRLVDGLAPVWDQVRTTMLEAAFDGPESLRPAAVRTLAVGRSLHSYARHHLPDPRERKVLEHLVAAAGSDPRRTPAFVAVHAYVERTFGLWTCPGGLARLADALAERIRERGVVVRLDTEATAITTDGSRVSGVRLAGGDRLRADVVVAGVDVRALAGRLLRDAPRSLRRAARMVRTTSGQRIVHVGLRAAAELPFETVVHGSGPSDPGMIVVRAPEDPSLAPTGHRAVTVLASGHDAGGDKDPLETLAARGLDVRADVVARIDAEPQPYGPVWRDWWRGLGVPTNRTPVHGLFVVGGTAHPGPGVPSVFLGAATVAHLVGSAR